MPLPEILILGVGNVLLGDEGIGVHTVRRLREEYDFPPNVRLLDGGTLGLALLGDIEGCDILLVADAVRGGKAPGTVYRLEGAGLRSSLGLSDSMHQRGLEDTLIMCELSGGKRPCAVVFGLEPDNISDLTPELSATARAAQPRLCGAIAQELERLGCPARKKA